ncbi:MAG: hypothetical protein KDC66_05045 [Phaeodactylibacter sp.]|nr:hypothetical protein [Phaeodactylibacter sp.]MCB9272439.1 hypothetical protein [Lewinellaceae bacterium]
MIKKRFLLPVLVALLAGCSSSPCGNDKDSFLKGYYQLVEEAAGANLPVSDSRWEKYDERFRAYVEECYDLYEAELSGREKRRFWGRSLRYYAQRYGDGVARELGRKGDKASRRIREETETLWGKTEKALEEVLGQ